MMSFNELQKAFELGKKQFDDVMCSQKTAGFRVIEEYGNVAERDTFQNRIACGDNMLYMADMIKNRNMAGKLQLIYVDPPFFSKEKYSASIRMESETLGRSELIKVGAYDDLWDRNLSQYLSMLTARLFMMKELLSEEGCLWIHLDWHVVHYVKMILDNIFGEENFVNEVIWTYKSGGSNKRSFARKHDNLLFYGKSPKYRFNILKEKSYNRGYKPYRFKGVEEFEDELGWYTLVNMKDVWAIDMVGRTSSERSGYATQKPEKLLERIVESCSRKGDICADFFAGSGTLGAVCEKLGRKWIMCDESGLSTACQIQRLGANGAHFAVETEEDENCSTTAGTCGELKAVIEDGRVVLTDYVLEENENLTMSCDKAGMKEIKRYAQNDSLSLIKCWSVDFDYDGSVHKADRLTDSTERSCSAAECKAGCNVNIAGYDVLGNRASVNIKRLKTGNE